MVDILNKLKNFITIRIDNRIRDLDKNNYDDLTKIKHHIYFTLCHEKCFYKCKYACVFISCLSVL